MKPLIAVLLIIAVAAACGRIARAETGVRITAFPGSRDAAGVHIAYLVEAAGPVAITVTGGDVRVSSVSSSDGWRATITGTLDSCHGALVVGGETIVQQRCTWLPEVVR